MLSIFYRKEMSLMMPMAMAFLTSGIFVSKYIQYIFLFFMTTFDFFSLDLQRMSKVQT